MLIWLTLGTLAVAGTACSSGGGGGGRVRDDLTIEDAEARLKEIVLDTAEAAAPGLPHPVFSDIGPTGCEDADISKHVFRTWSVNVMMQEGREPADLLGAVESHWKQRGYDVDRDRLEDPQPELLGRAEGFVFRALAVPGSGQLNIGGDTPCVPNPDGRKEK